MLTPFQHLNISLRNSLNVQIAHWKKCIASNTFSKEVTALRDGKLEGTHIKCQANPWETVTWAALFWRGRGDRQAGYYMELLSDESHSEQLKVCHLGWSCCQRWVKSGGVAASPELRECRSKNVNHFFTAALRSSEDWSEEETTPLWPLIFSWITRPSELWYLFLFLSNAQKKKWKERMNKPSFIREKYYSFRASITCHFCSCGILCILLYSLFRIELNWVCWCKHIKYSIFILKKKVYF